MSGRMRTPRTASRLELHQELRHVAVEQARDAHACFAEIGRRAHAVPAGPIRAVGEDPTGMSAGENKPRRRSKRPDEVGATSAPFQIFLGDLQEVLYEFFRKPSIPQLPSSPVDTRPTV